MWTTAPQSGRALDPKLSLTKDDCSQARAELYTCWFNAAQWNSCPEAIGGFAPKQSVRSTESEAHPSLAYLIRFSLADPNSLKDLIRSKKRSEAASAAVSVIMSVHRSPSNSRSRSRSNSPLPSWGARHDLLRKVDANQQMKSL
jgi:hypothetical protein